MLCKSTKLHEMSQAVRGDLLEGLEQGAADGTCD